MNHADVTKIDVAIIGAGPAGSAAAIELGRAGRRVVLIEKRHFPREKVCGGCLSASAAARLRALTGPHRVPPGVAGRRVTFVIGSYRLSCEPRGATWMVARSDMDVCLANAALAAGAEIWFGNAASLDQGQRGWDVVVGARRVIANAVLIASGLGRLPRQIGIEGRRVGRPMIAQNWIQPAAGPSPREGEVELHWLRGGYVGLAALRTDTCVVALAAEIPNAASANVLDWLRRRNPKAAIWGALGAGGPRSRDQHGTAGFPWVPQRLGDANALLIGDAAGFAEPYSGEGIEQALRSADCAVRAIVGGGDMLPTYTTLMRRHRRIVWRTRALGAILRQSIVHYLTSGRPVLPQRALARLVEHVHVKGAV